MLARRILPAVRTRALICPVPHLGRHISTTSTSDPTNTATAHSPTASTAAPAAESLDWDTFLHLRHLKRQYNLVASIFTSFTTTSLGLGYFANKEIDLTQMIMGVDPFVMFGLATVACGATGWLIGPSIGGAAFRLSKRGYLKQISAREKEFLQHIRKNRVDPSFQSFSNPVPDYYGEKIGSLKQYRQWLKDQRAYNKKRERFL